MTIRIETRIVNVGQAHEEVSMETFVCDRCGAAKPEVMGAARPRCNDCLAVKTMSVRTETD